MLIGHEKKNADLYNKMARSEKYFSLTEEGGRAGPAEVAAFSRLPMENTVVDVGCGLGAMTAINEQLGITGYLGIDVSRGMVQRAKERCPNYAFEEGSIYELGKKYPGRFDGFYLMFVLHHLPHHRVHKALTSLRAALTPGAVGLFACPVAQEDDCGVSDETGLRTWGYTFASMQDAFMKAGLAPHFKTSIENIAAIGDKTFQLKMAYGIVTVAPLIRP